MPEIAEAPELPGDPQPARIVGSRLWAAFAALAVAAGIAATWAGFGSLHRNLDVAGVTLHGGSGPLVARATASGSLITVLVPPGSRVKAGQSVAEVRVDTSTAPEDSGTAVSVLAPVSGLVTGVLVHPGHPVSAGTGILAIDPIDQPLTVRLFLTKPDDLAQLTPGRRAIALINGQPIEGEITGRELYPVTAAHLAQTLTVPVPGMPGPGEPVWTAYVSFDAAPPVPALTPVRVTVRLDSRRPYQVLFGRGQ